MIEALNAVVTLLKCNRSDLKVEIWASFEDMTAIHVWRDGIPEEIDSRLTFVYLAWVTPGSLMIRNMPACFSV